MSSILDHNFCVVENDLWEFNITLRDQTTQLPIDLTGATIRMDVRSTFTSALVVHDFSIGDGIIVTTPASGLAAFSKLAAIAAGEYVYDLQYNFGGAGPKTRLRGRVNILPEVTQGA